MRNLQEIRDIFKENFSQIRYSSYPEHLYEPIEYILSLNGKQLRPVLLLLAAEMFEGDVKKAIKPALAIEWFHNFTLMHDDIMDKAPLRRGFSTVHEKWNLSTAILSGDVMLVKAYEFLEDLDEDVLIPVFKVFNKTAIEVCEGQQIDMNFESELAPTEEMYLEMIRLKTSVLIACALSIGAIIAKTTPENAKLMYDIGENIGLAFQLQDDLLDVFGSPEKFGKQVGGDILTNKKTFLLIKALEHSSEKQREELDYWINVKEYNPKEKIAAVKRLFSSIGVDKLTFEKINGYTQKARLCLDLLEIPDERKNPMRDLFVQLLERDV